MESADEDLRKALGIVLKEARLRKNLSILELAQQVSGRTYLSALERGEKMPTIGKVDEISRELGLHPLTLLTLTYLHFEGNTPEGIMTRIKTDMEAFGVWEAGEHGD